MCIEASSISDATNIPPRRPHWPSFREAGSSCRPRQAARELRSLVLHVPSALVLEEKNAVLNPAHREFAAVRMAIEREFRYDDRMYRPRRSRTVSR